MAVKPHTRPEAAMMAADLRAFCARHCVRSVEIARRRHCHPSAVRKALTADRKARPVSLRLLGEIKGLVVDILLERERSAKEERNHARTV